MKTSDRVYQATKMDKFENGLRNMILRQAPL